MVNAIELGALPVERGRATVTALAAVLQVGPEQFGVRPISTQRGSLAITLPVEVVPQLPLFLVLLSAIFVFRRSLF
jgi:hypothetical protein